MNPEWFADGSFWLIVILVVIGLALFVALIFRSLKTRPRPMDLPPEEVTPKGTQPAHPEPAETEPVPAEPAIGAARTPVVEPDATPPRSEPATGPVETPVAGEPVSPTPSSTVEPAAPPAVTGGPSTMTELERAYRRGEIGKQEYERRKAELSTPEA